MYSGAAFVSSPEQKVKNRIANTVEEARFGNPQTYDRFTVRRDGSPGKLYVFFTQDATTPVFEGHAASVEKYLFDETNPTPAKAS